MGLEVDDGPSQQMMHILPHEIIVHQLIVDPSLRSFANIGAQNAFGQFDELETGVGGGKPVSLVYVHPDRGIYESCRRRDAGHWTSSSWAFLRKLGFIAGVTA